MKNLKRLIALVAVFAMALTTIAGAASFSDVAEDSAYYEAVETLSKLGVIDGYTDGTFKPEQAVTRAEMAKLIATMQGFGDSAESGSVTKFSDVPASHWASGYIANATGVAINGMPDGTFAPDRTVKYEEAVKMIMATLGYTVIANSNGGYPMGYVSAAIKEGVTKNVSNANVGSDANRGTIAQLIYNAIDTPLVEQTSWNNDGSGEYTKYDGTGNKAYKTLMSENLDVVKMKGVVLSNSYMSLEGAVTIDKEDDPEVKITVTYGYNVTDNDFFDKDGDSIYPNGYDFLVGGTDAEDYVGKAVIYFAMQNDYDEWELISISEDTTYNKSVTFSLADYDEDDTEEGKLYYYKNGSTTGTKLTIQDEAKVLYNNAYYDGDVYSLISRLKSGNFGGQVTVVDTDKTTGYDVIIVEAAVSAVVDEVSKGVIRFKESAALPVGGAISKIDTDDDAVVVALIKDGKEITVDDVAEDDVLSIVTASKDGVYVVVDVMSNILEGTVSSTKKSTTSATDKAYKIDGTWYDSAIDSLDVAAGDTGKFYIDKYGKIAYYDETSSYSGNYAYVLASLVSDDNWGNNKLELKLLTKDGVKTYEVAEKYKIDGSATKDVDDLTVDDTDALGVVGEVIDVTFSGNYVKAIVTKDKDEDKFKKEADITNVEFDAETFELGRYDCDEDSIVFFVEDSDSDCYVGTLADLEDTAIVSGTAYTDKNADNDINIIVLKGVGTTISASSELAVVVDIDDTKNDDGEDIYALTLLYKGEEVVYNTTTKAHDDYTGNLSTGDVLKIKVTGAGIVTKMEAVFDFEDDDVRAKYDELDLESVFADNAKTDEAYVFGYAQDYKSTGKKVTLVDGTEVKLSGCKNIYVIDGTGRNLDIYEGTTSDIYYDKNIATADKITKNNSNEELTKEQVLDIVIVRQYDGDPIDLVIIKGTEDYDLD